MPTESHQDLPSMRQSDLVEMDTLKGGRETGNTTPQLNPNFKVSDPVLVGENTKAPTNMNCGSHSPTPIEKLPERGSLLQPSYRQVLAPRDSERMDHDHGC